MPPIKFTERIDSLQDGSGSLSNESSIDVTDDATSKEYKEEVKKSFIKLIGEKEEMKRRDYISIEFKKSKHVNDSPR